MPALRALSIACFLMIAVPALARAQVRCAGDCDGNGSVVVGEVVLCVQIPLGGASLADCPDADASEDGQVGIDDLIAAVEASLESCRSPQPTPSSTSPSSASPTPSSSPTSTPSASPTPTTGAPPAVPIEGTALQAWLEAESYLGWAAEGTIHPPDSPHPSLVRVFVNDPLRQSLEEGRDEHPTGAAAVKEIYDSRSELRGWAVTVKVQETGDGGRGWYWYERVGSSLYADGTGVTLCTGCHAEGIDFFRTPFPLRP